MDFDFNVLKKIEKYPDDKSIDNLIVFKNVKIH